jgi:hypothetical protein
MNLDVRRLDAAVAYKRNQSGDKSPHFKNLSPAKAGPDILSSVLPRLESLG